jgi:hypothetical protein
VEWGKWKGESGQGKIEKGKRKGKGEKEKGKRKGGGYERVRREE